MIPTVVKAADAAQFLSFIPRMLGYQPAQSLVVIPFDGARSLGAMRFDLPPDEDPDASRIAATVIGMVCRVSAADAVAAVAYTDAAFAERGRMPHRGLLEALQQRAHTCGLRVTDLLCVAGDGWGSVLDPECPATGRSPDELSRATAQLAGLPEPDGDQATGAELPACSPDERERVAEALGDVDRAVAALCGPEDHCPGGEGERPADAAAGARPPAVDRAGDLGPVPAPLDDAADEASGSSSAHRLDPRALAAVCRLDDLPGFFEHVLDTASETRDAHESAALIWCLSRPSLRDVALVQWSGNLAQGDEALDAQLRWEDGEEYPAHLAMRMWGEGDPPSVARLERALAVVRHVAAAAPTEFMPGPLSMCAWLAWALGRSTHAAAYAGRAREIEPDHGLSQIVLSFVDAAHLPDWAFRRASA
jgi:hypothetical protein